MSCSSGEPQLISPTCAADSRRNGTTMLARQLRLRLIAEDSDIPRSCTNIVVSIHAIATFESFNAYLRPRILAAQQSDRLGGGASGGGTLSSLLAAFAAAAGAEGADDEDADGAMLSSSPPPRRTELGDGSALSASLGTASTSSAGASSSKPKPSASPKRRRSSRLSGKGVDLADAAADGQPQASSSKPAEAYVPTLFFCRALLAHSASLQDGGARRCR